MATATELLDRAIADLESRLGLQPGQSIGGKPNVETVGGRSGGRDGGNKNQGGGKAKSKGSVNNNKEADNKVREDQPDICKLEFKVGQIVKVWNHPEADKLYCEEIDCGEENTRQIASGLRPHFTLEQMQGQRLLVVSNLKAKNLVKFKSHGMVLCAATTPTADGEGERVEFIEPPADAKIGEVVSFEGLPTPEPWPSSQVEKKKVFAACMDGMRTTDDCVAAWNGHAFMTSAGPCKAKTVAGGVMR